MVNLVRVLSLLPIFLVGLVFEHLHSFSSARLILTGLSYRVQLANLVLKTQRERQSERNKVCLEGETSSVHTNIYLFFPYSWITFSSDSSSDLYLVLSLPLNPRNLSHTHTCFSSLPISMFVFHPSCFLKLYSSSFFRAPSSSTFSIFLVPSVRVSV